MKLTNKQKAMLHMIPNTLGIDDAQRRIIQRNVGGFHSAKDTTATHEGFAAVMAYYEQQANGKLDGYTAGYWQAQHEKNENAGGHDNNRIIYRILQAGDLLGMGRLDVEAFLASDHMSGGMFVSLDDCDYRWLQKLLDGLSARIRRKTSQALTRSTEPALPLF